METRKAYRGIDENVKLLEERWKTGEFGLILDKIELTKRWPKEAQEVRG